MIPPSEALFLWEVVTILLVETPAESHEELISRITSKAILDAATAAAEKVADAAIATASVLAKENSRVLLEMAVLKNDMATVKKQQDSFESEIAHKMESIETKFEKVFGMIGDMTKELTKQISDMSAGLLTKLNEVVQGRPTWAVTLTIGGLLSLCVGLIVFVVSSGKVF
jgi:hypothetical protein